MVERRGGNLVIEGEKYVPDGAALESVHPGIADLILESMREGLDLELSMFPHELSFYINPSCPIELFPRLRIGGSRRVMTVAGSGDFYQSFINAGCSEVDVFDLSLPALAYNELQLAGLRVLGLEEFKTCFLSWKFEGKSKIVDEKIYQKLRNVLSPFSLKFWDGFIEERLNVLGDSNYGYNGIIRSRTVRYKEGTNKLIGGDRLLNKRWYSKFQNKVEQAKVSFLHCDANNLISLDMLSQVDLVYLSNIEYSFNRTLSLAMAIKSAMRPRAKIAFTSHTNEGCFNRSQTYRRSKDGELVDMRNMTFKKYFKVSDETVPVVCYYVDGDVVEGGEKRKVYYRGYGREGQVEVKFLGYDHCVGYGVLLEI